MSQVTYLDEVSWLFLMEQVGNQLNGFYQQTTMKALALY